MVAAATKKAPLNLNLFHVIALAITRALRVPLVLVTASVLARLLGPEGVGKWSMVMAAGALLHSAFFSWTHAISVRFGCEEWERDRRLDATVSKRLPLLIVGWALSVAVVFFAPRNYAERIFSLSNGYLWVVLTYTVSIWLLAELRSVMQIMSRYWQIATISLLVEMAGAGFLVVVLISGVELATLPALAGLSITMALAAIMPSIVEYRRCVRAPWWPSRSEITQGVVYAWPLIPGFILGFLSDWFDHLLLQSYFATREVGLFQAAYQLMLLLASLCAPISTVLLPRLINRTVADPSTASRFVQKIVPTVIVLWFPIVAIAVAVAPYCVFLLYGAKFAESKLVLAILCISVPGTILTSLYGTLFSLQGRLGRNIVYLGIMAGINIAISVALVPSMGVSGAAIGTVVSYLVSQGLYAFDQHQHTGVAAGRHILLFIAIGSYSVVQVVIIDSLLWRTVLAVAFSILIFLLARSLRLVDGETLKQIFSGRLASVSRILTRILVERELQQDIVAQ